MNANLTDGRVTSRPILLVLEIPPGQILRSKSGATADSLKFERLFAWLKSPLWISGTIFSLEAE